MNSAEPTQLQYVCHLLRRGSHGGIAVPAALDQIDVAQVVATVRRNDGSIAIDYLSYIKYQI